MTAGRATPRYPTKGDSLYSKPVAEPRKAVHAPQPLDHFELRALKKMIGNELLAEIEGAAEAEGKSLAEYVRETLRDHARKLK